MERQTATKTKPESSTSSPLSRGILQRKCACGNQNVGGGECAECSKKKELLQRRAVHLSEPGDRYEQEADRIADQVMRMPEPTAKHQVELEKEGVVQRKAIANSITPLQSSSTGHEQLSEVPPIVDEVLGSPGQSLDKETRAFMEPRFGRNFAQVRVHTDTGAAESAKAIQALAYTHDKNIVFAEGMYAAGTHEGQRLLAHELAHVVQQDGGHINKENEPQQSPALVVQRDDIRPATSKNDVWMGQETGSLALPGTKFVSDPYDHTVLVISPDGTGVQYTYEIVQIDDEPRERLIHTEVLSKLRVQALERMNAAGAGEAQEGADGPKNRKKADHDNGERRRKEWVTAHPDEYKKYQDQLSQYQTDVNALPPGKKPPPPPPAPKGYPADNKTTLCTNWPVVVYHSAGGNKQQSFNFTPPKDLPGWRTLETNPDGPKPGDIYYLWDTDLNRAAHMGVFKSATPVPGKENLMRWVVTDGGQGKYEEIQQVNERSRTFNKKTGMFSSDLADGGQEKGNRKLVGWIDIEAQQAANPTGR
jgi:hypothetical protein